jgi:hypothetical protein
MKKRPQHRWIDELGDEDLAFVKRLVLASGSLKEVAASYGVSYPTVRRRLDRVIAKISVLEDPAIESPFERVVRLLFADGRIDATTMKTLLTAHGEEIGR